MNDVAVGVIGVLAAGHDDEVLVTGVDDLNVVNGQLTVKGDRYDGLHGAVVEKLSDLDICDIHICFLRC